MKLKIISVGHLKKGSEYRLLFEMYRKRLRWDLEAFEIDSRKYTRPLDQENRILSAIPDQSYVFALDETGKTLSSNSFAQNINKLKEEYYTSLCFIIGPAEGLTQALKDRANFLMSFGKQTWPHQLVRVMLIEQLYRAQQILAGHPYHRD